MTFCFNVSQTHGKKARIGHLKATDQIKKVTSQFLFGSHSFCVLEMQANLHNPISISTAAKRLVLQVLNYCRGLSVKVTACG